MFLYLVIELGNDFEKVEGWGGLLEWDEVVL